ncbi:MAG: hypothetical protein GTO23_01960 [Nitrososphaeria archaeon]|nr:hypothetical protein [Nitrososphaeria archaeon]
MNRAVAAIERAKAADEKISQMASEFSLSVAYLVKNLPQELREQYRNKEVIAYIELDHGALKSFTIGTEVPKGKKPDFTVESEYEVAKQNFLGELNPISTFIKRRIKVEPARKLYLNPSFSAKSLTTIIALLQVMRDVPTRFHE